MTDTPSSAEPAPPGISTPASAPAQCRFCKRAIASEYAYCPHCGRRQSPHEGLLYRPIPLVLLAFLVLGALAIPLVVRSPYLNRREKTLLNIAIVIYTVLVFYLLYVATAQLIQGLSGDLSQFM